MSVNSVNISGNLTRDSEHKALPSGTQLLEFSVAVNDRRKNARTGEWEDHPNYVDCVMYGDRAAKLADWLRKGTKVVVSGKLSYRSWEAKDGTKRSKLDVVVSELDFASTRQRERQPEREVEPDFYDEEIPF